MAPPSASRFAHESTRGENDRATLARNPDQPIAVCGNARVELATAAADGVAAGQVDIRGGPARFDHGMAKAAVKSELPGLARKVEIGGGDHNADHARRVADSQRWGRDEGGEDDAEAKALGHGHFPCFEEVDNDPSIKLIDPFG
jgi:hypothetical protein